MTKTTLSSPHRGEGWGEGEGSRELSYRPEEELEEWKKRCPIEKLKSELIEKNILTCSLAKKISDKIDGEIEEAVKFAEESPYPYPQEALDDLFFEGALR